MNKSKIKFKNCFFAALGGIILAFGLYNVHSLSDVTEGGILGVELLLHYHFDISPALSGFIMNAVCYAFGFFMLGWSFALYSAVAGGSFSLFYFIFEQFPPVYPQIASYPLVAAVVGALFVGGGVGIAVRAGGAPCGDDALAMGLCKITKIPIQWIYLFGDVTVLALSLTYIPLKRILYSLITVCISSPLVGIIAKKKE